MKKIAISYHYIAHYRVPVFKALADELKNNEFEYSFISGELAADENINTIDVKKMQLPIKVVKNRWLTKDILWQSGILRLLRNSEFDVVIFLGNMYFLSTWVALLYFKFTKTKTLLWTHGVLKDEAGVKGFFRRVFYRLSDGLLLYGNRAKNLLEKKQFNAEFLHVIYNSLDYDKQLFHRMHAGKKSDVRAYKHNSSIKVIFTGRLREDRRLDLLLGAISDLDDKLVNIELLIVGDGDIKDDLVEMTRKLAIEDSVIFYGACYDEGELASLFLSADICVVPGIVGLNCIHALTYGVPVITSDLFERHGPEVEVIIEGVTGGFYAYENIQSLSDQIFSWKHMVDDKSENVRNRCYEAVESRYTPRAQVNLVNDVIRGLVD